MQTFLENVPEGLHAPIVVVMHLSPAHDSKLADLLASSTVRRVSQVEQDTELEPDHVYIIPPNRNLSVVDTHLRLTELEAAIGDRAPIDHFFRTVADTHGAAAVAVVLTGTGSDGTVGVKQVKEAGGMVAIQDPDEAKYDSMPRSVLESGVADVVAPLHDLPGAIGRFLNATRVDPTAEVHESEDDDERDVLQRILTLVRNRRGHDFRAYKRTSVGRRVRHRLHVLGIGRLEEYERKLDDDPEEVDQLARDLLITVTHFFRGADAFDHLAEHVIPALFEGKDGGDQVRAWSVGCATGEEAYSVAMLLLEHAATLDEPPDVQVFASDVHDEALEVARKGRYPQGIANDVDSERLARFFTEVEGGYRVKKELRETVLFARHDLLTDPPFLHLDLVVCRNLLIYLSREVHEDLFQLFHHALRTGGHLMLGSSESVEGSSLFDDTAARLRIFRRLDGPSTARRAPTLPLRARHPARSHVREAVDEAEPTGYPALHRRMLERHGPPNVLVDRNYEIVRLSEDVGRYLQPPAGDPTHNLLKVVHEALRVEVHAAVRRALDEGGPVRMRPVSVRADGSTREVSVWAHAAAAEGDLAGLVLVVFQESEPAPAMEAVEDDVSTNQAADVESTRRRLRAVIAEYETSQEELRASNEELQSINEELQSTTEELQTSKEELESMNEELLAVSQEYKSEIAALEDLAADQWSMLRTIGVAALLLDRELRVRRFTPKVHDLFNLVATDMGRPLAHVTHRIGTVDVTNMAATVLEDQSRMETIVHDADGQDYRMVVAPTFDADEAPSGVVIHFVEVTTTRGGHEGGAYLRDVAGSGADGPSGPTS